MSTRMYRILSEACLVGLAITVILAQPGCSSAEDPSRALADYRLAVAQALGLNAVDLPDYPAFALDYPQKLARTVAVSEVNVGLRNFWAFKHCGLRAAIARRNTALGRAPSAVVQMPYEHDLLFALEQCAAAVDRSELSAEVAKVLDEVRGRKIETRAAVFWNGTFGSGEFVRLFSPSARILGAQAGVSQVPTAEIDFLRRFRHEFGRVASQDIQVTLAWAYQGLEVSEYGGSLLKSLHEANFYLDQINGLLGKRLAQGKVCLMAAPNRGARELEGAFRRYHIRVIQPYLAAVGRTGRGWIQSVGQLAQDQLTVMPIGFKPFYQRYLNDQNPDGLWQQHLRAVGEHARLWSALFEQCGIALR